MDGASASGKPDLFPVASDNIESLTKEWFDLITKNANRDVSKEDVQALIRLIEKYRNNFASELTGQNPLFWRDVNNYNRNALHMLLDTEGINGAEGSPLFLLLQYNAQYKGDEDALMIQDSCLDAGPELKTAFELGIQNRKIRKKGRFFEKTVTGDEYLTSISAGFLEQSSKKMDADQNSLLHLMARCESASIETFLKLQEIMETNSDKTLEELMMARNKTKRTPLEAAIVSGNFGLAQQLLTGDSKDVKTSQKHKRRFVKINLDAKNSNGERLLDLFLQDKFSSTARTQTQFKDFTIKNLAIYHLENEGEKLTPKQWERLGMLPRDYKENLRASKNSLQYLIANSKDLGPNLDLGRNPIQECLRMGFFEEALELIKKSNRDTIVSKDKDKGRDNVLQAIEKAQREIDGTITGLGVTKCREYFNGIFTKLKAAEGEIRNKRLIREAAEETTIDLRTIRSDRRDRQPKDPQDILDKAVLEKGKAPQSNIYTSSADTSSADASSANYDGSGGHNDDDDEGTPEVQPRQQRAEVLARAIAAAAATLNNLYQAAGSSQARLLSTSSSPLPSTTTAISAQTTAALDNSRSAGGGMGRGDSSHAAPTHQNPQRGGIGNTLREIDVDDGDTPA